MIDAYELDRMRADLLPTLPDKCDILSGTASVDGMGGETITWGTATANVSCRLDARTGYEAVAGGGVQAYQVMILTVPQSTTITTAQRVKHSTGTYNVVSVTSGSWLACKRAEVRHV